jgi:hypothetical protein
MIVKKPKHITMLELKTKAREAKGKVNHIYLHWTGECYEQPDDQYHLCVDRQGQVYICCKGFTEKKEHIWLRDQGSIAIALCCGAGSRCWVPGVGNPRTAWGVTEISTSTPDHCARIDFGSAPPTLPQIEKMAKLVAILCGELELAVSRDTVMTHCEAAFKDSYGPGSGDPDARWDLWFLPDPKHYGKLTPGGELIRGKAIEYGQKDGTD